MKRIWLLYDLFVAPEARKAGVAQQLIARADQLAKETDSAFIMLSTATDNVKAQALYEKKVTLEILSSLFTTKCSVNGCYTKRCHALDFQDKQ